VVPRAQDASQKFAKAVASLSAADAAAVGLDPGGTRVLEVGAFCGDIRPAWPRTLPPWCRPAWPLPCGRRRLADCRNAGNMLQRLGQRAAVGVFGTLATVLTFRAAAAGA
jgi:hypothetical protein